VTTVRHRGLTWDHPRGRAALEAAAPLLASHGEELRWDVHSLEGFESAPIQELARRYDLIVLDHPHLGDAMESGSLQPIEDVLGTDFVSDVAARAVGPSLSTYQLAGATWALPLDAATQTSARRADLVPHAPRTWEEVVALSSEMPVGLSISGPHAYLTFASVCASLGSPLASDNVRTIVDPAVGERALSILRAIAAEAAADISVQNPIALLERMTSTDDVAYIPLVYQYVGYADSGRTRRVTFDTAPAGPDGFVGSTIGGTGIAVTRRATVTPALQEHLIWLLSDEAQRTFIPQHQGQPSVCAAWDDPAVNAASGDFYRNTRATIESAWTRPRFPGFTPLQTEMSREIRDALFDSRPATDLLTQLTDMHNAVARHRDAPEVIS
jgi:multiple sugar transport system substrate-binding protein